MNYPAKKIINHLLKQVYNVPFIEKKSDVAHQIAIAEYAKNIPSISPKDQNLITTLKNKGVAMTSLRKLGIDATAEMLQTASELSSEIGNTSENIQDGYVIHAPTEQMINHPEILLWGLEERILRIAESYLGLPVAYQGAYLRRDIANQVQEKSRLWHIDTEDRQVFKIIIYLHDVNEGNGPFQYIPKDVTSKLVKELNYKSGYIQDQKMNDVDLNINYKSCLGTAGTVIIAATSTIFHRGKIPTSSDRFAIFFDYTSRFIKYPFYSEYLFPQSDLLRLSENISEYQKQCLLWNEYTLN
jgi:hypothetical protein